MKLTKANRFILFFLLSFTTFFGYAQSKPDTDFVKSSQLYIVVNGKYLKFHDLKNSTITKLLGTPLKIKNEKAETNDAKNTRTYVYPNGDVVLEDGVLSFITIRGKGWYLAFKTGNSFTKPITVGNSLPQLQKLFPVSWQYRSKPLVYVQIDNCDCNIYFFYTGNQITELGFNTNES